MGKKKGGKQQHLQQSLGQMVSKAALAQLGPHIAEYVDTEVKRLGSKLARQSASTYETLFSRLVVAERILMEKHGYTAEDLAERVSNLEDEKDNLTKVDQVEKGDTVRIAVKTKTNDQTDYQGTSKLKVQNIGSGVTLGEELESAILGMKTGEVKTITFGQDKALTAEITLSRVSRGPKPDVSEELKEEAINESQAPG